MSSSPVAVAGSISAALRGGVEVRPALRSTIAAASASIRASTSSSSRTSSSVSVSTPGP
jgi:hypothetical protein